MKTTLNLMQLVAHTLPQVMHQQQRLNLAWDIQQNHSPVVVRALM
jgi:hypothetical protein